MILLTARSVSESESTVYASVTSGATAQKDVCILLLTASVIFCLVYDYFQALEVI